MVGWLSLQAAAVAWAALLIVAAVALVEGWRSLVGRSSTA